MARKRKTSSTRDDTLMPPLHRYQHDAIERAKESRGAKIADVRPLRVTTQTMLERYLVRRHLSQGQYAAGDRLAQTFHGAGGFARTTGSYEPRVDGQSIDALLRHVSALEQVRAPLRWVGQQLSVVLVDVCIMDHSARDWAVRHHNNSDAGIVVLRLALDRLAEFYGKTRNA